MIESNSVGRNPDSQYLEIQCEEVRKRFVEFDDGDIRRLIFKGTLPGGGFDALVDVSLEVPRGKFLGILGRNGAGKSTLLRTIGGIYRPTSGVVRLGDQASGIYEIGVTGQQLMTGRQFARRWLQLNGLSGRKLSEAIEDIRVFSELEEYFDRQIRSYSTGMKARIFFGVATAVIGKIFLIDEVLSVGDIYFTAKCWRRLRQRLASGASGILATHDWTSVLKICDEACILERGCIVERGTAAEIVKEYIDVPDLASNLAWFLPGCPESVTATAGEDLSLVFPIGVNTDSDVMFSMSIEQFFRGEGWEHVLHLDPTPVAKSCGHRDVNVRISKLPLKPGEYTLNISLSLRSPENEGEFIPCDVRGWIHNQGLRLTVGGETASQGYPLFAKWAVS